MFSILEAKISTRLFNDEREGRVIDVTYAWEKVVLDLEIQATKQPALYSTPSRKIHRGFHLMNRPRIFHRLLML